MFTLREVGVSLLAAALFCLPLNAQAGAGPRLVPKGTVTLLESGTSVDQEIPAPAGMLMACKGQCYVEAGGMRLMGADGTVFGVRETPELFSVMVREGSVDFALSADAKPMELNTPFDTLTARPYAVPASEEGVITGNLSVTDERAVLTLAQGSLELTNSQGQTLLHAGSALTLVQSPYKAGSEQKSFDMRNTISGWVVGVGALAIMGASVAALSGGGGDDGGGGDATEVSPD